MKSAQYKGDRSIAVGSSEVIKPGPGEARLEVAYCGICGTDIHIFHGVMDARVNMPQIIGHEASATVAEIGEGVTSVAVGDRVAVRPLFFGEPAAFDKGHAHVGKNLKFIGIDMPGGMQSSWTVPAFTLHQLPESLNLQHGAMIEPAAVACHDVRLGEVKPVNLFKFFWSEIKMIGARLYEQQDFDEAIALADSGKLHLEKLITQVSPIDQVQQTFEAIDANPDGIKYLIQCS